MKDLTTVLAAVKRERTRSDAVYVMLSIMSPKDWTEMLQEDVDDVKEAMDTEDKERILACAIELATTAVCLAENAEDLFDVDQ